MVGSRTFDDHYRYTAEDLKTVQAQARDQQATLILTTQKDWTKIVRTTMPRQTPPLAYLAIALQITTGEELLTALIDRVLNGRIPGPE
jgi:tetraacyldisaccharide-1-P 4'-kinase